MIAGLSHEEFSAVIDNGIDRSVNCATTQLASCA